MNTRFVLAGMTGVVLMGMASLASAAGSNSMSLNGFKHHVLPVLVTVDKQGHVTDMASAYELRPEMRRAVHHAVDGMITGPAVWKDKPIASQVVLNLALDAKPQDDGKYAVRWVYAGSQPVPYDPSWTWSHIDGHRLALQNANNRRRYDFRPPHRDMIRTRRPRNMAPSHTAPQKSSPAHTAPAHVSRAAPPARVGRSAPVQRMR